jgi:arylsulfatase A-like enzyme
MFGLISGVCRKAEAQEHTVPLRYNVIVVVVDALRPDHLSCYGYFRKTSPHIDSAARQGVLFENCISQAWYTLPSHASLFTSKYVHSHNVTEKETRLPASEITLAEILKIYGYETAAFTGGVFFNPAYGLNQGFDTYYDHISASQGKFSAHIGASNEIMPKALQWMEHNKDKDFFMFIHSYDLFMPCRISGINKNMFDPVYQGAADELLQRQFLRLSKTSRDTYAVTKGKNDIEEITLNQADIRHIIANYDAGIASSDASVGDLLKKIEELNLDGKTIVILTADHGIDLLGHNTLHCYMSGSGYDEVLRVPLIIKYPGVKAKAKIIKSQVQLIDLMPTVLDFLRIPIPKEVQGKSIFPLFYQGNSVGFNESVFSGWNDVLAVRSRGWKLIYSRGSYELYNLNKDPRELKNLAQLRPDVFMRLIRQLFSWAQEARLGDFDNTIELSVDLTENLKRAGYW